MKYLSGLLADERCRRECLRWNLVPHVVALLEADRAALQADLTSSSPATLTSPSPATLTSWRMVAWSAAVFYSVAQALRRVTHTLSASGGEGQVDVDFVAFVGRRMQSNAARFFPAPWRPSSFLAVGARTPSTLVRALSCLAASNRRPPMPAESPSVFPFFRPSQLRVSPSAFSSAVLFSLLVLGPLLLWRCFLTRLGQVNAIAADWAGGEQHPHHHHHRAAVRVALAEAAEALRAGGPDLAARRAEKGPPDRAAGIRADRLTVSSPSGVRIRVG